MTPPSYEGFPGYGYDSDCVFHDDFQYLSPGVFDGARSRYDWDTDFGVLFKRIEKRKPKPYVECYQWDGIGTDTLGSAKLKPGTYERRGKHEPKHKKKELVKKQIRAYNKKHPKLLVKTAKKTIFCDDDFF